MHVCQIYRPSLQVSPLLHLPPFVLGTNSPFLFQGNLLQSTSVTCLSSRVQNHTDWYVTDETILSGFASLHYELCACFVNVYLHLLSCCSYSNPYLTAGKQTDNRWLVCVTSHMSVRQSDCISTVNEQNEVTCPASGLFLWVNTFISCVKAFGKTTLTDNPFTKSSIAHSSSVIGSCYSKWIITIVLSKKVSVFSLKGLFFQPYSGFPVCFPNSNMESADLDVIHKGHT